MTTAKLIIAIACALAPIYSGRAEPATVSKMDVDFARDIQPILAEKCLACHGPEKHKSGLRLDSKSAALAGGDTGKAIIPGHATEGLLYKRIAGFDPEKVMPPKGERLSSRQVELIRLWIDQGASWPEDARPGRISAPTHWAFRAPVSEPPPIPKQLGWVRTSVDNFILARLERENIQPSKEADRTTLVKRVSLDLIGLLPTVEEVEAFVTSSAPDAYEQLVERLLASPHFGERWGRHWLDLARYADSDGYQIDLFRPGAYVYRQWVIEAVNQDMPFDQFTIWQLAGDLLPDATREQKIATGFHRQTLVNNEDGADREESACKARVDRVSVTGTTWLGLTLGCAECHSHKYDPISQREFYQLYAFFHEANESNISAPDPIETKKTKWLRRAWDKENSKLKEQIDTVVKNEAKLTEEAKAAELKRLNAALEEMKRNPAPEYAEPLALAFAPYEKPPKTHIHLRGDFLSKGEEVQPGTPAVLHAMKARSTHPNRLDLARWLVDPANPLTARVTVNHFWKHLFGHGLVNTEEDFGTQGDKPSHPELLDWLAVQFQRGGWSRKDIVRLIVNSATYRQSSAYRLDLVDKDPANVWLARQNRLRVESEIFRDIHLQAAGLLNLQIGGPGFRPKMPEDLYKIGYQFISSVTWPESTGPERYRRGMYIQAQRTIPYPLAMTFDAPDSTSTCVRRNRSNTPLQALASLNNAVFFETAQAFGAQIGLVPGKVQDKIARAFRVCFARHPSGEELSKLVSFYQEELAMLKARANVPPTATACAEGLTQEGEAYVSLAHLLMNLDEFTMRE